MSKAITEAMKPCPFCGGEPHLMHCGAGTYMIQCLACKATTDDGSQERITANWNRRSSLPATQAAIKPLNWQHDGNASYAYCPVTDVRWAARNQAERAHAEATREARIRSALVPPAVPGEVRAQLDLIKHLAEYTTEKNWDDKRLYIMQAVDRALSVPLPEIEGGDKGDGWQTIETAPKEATGCFEDACIIGFVTWGKEGRVHKHVGPAVWQEITGQWEFTETSFDIFPAPTHWHPFPSPASIEGETP